MDGWTMAIPETLTDIELAIGDSTYCGNRTYAVGGTVQFLDVNTTTGMISVEYDEGLLGMNENNLIVKL